MYYVYILQSLKDKRLYVGYSHDLKKRIEEHNKGSDGRKNIKVRLFNSLIN